MAHDSGIAHERAVKHYLDRRVLRPPRITTSPRADLGCIVAIPSHDEPDLLPTLTSITRCEPPVTRSVEILLFLNASESTTDAVRQRHYRTAELIGQAADKFAIPVHVLLDNALPSRSAGVGLARKLVMDEALQRFAMIGATNGVIATPDADCTVSRNYLTSLVDAFAGDKHLGAVAIDFEHRMQPEPEDTTGAEVGLDRSPLGKAATLYELYLRYYRLGLAWAGSTHAFHTVGSCMAVRARDYARVGGMNRRQAGEDFYFLQKFMDIGVLRALNEATVYPGVRESNRVPFGTGAAMRDALERGAAPRFPPLVGFAELGALFSISAALFEAPDAWRTLPPTLARWLETQSFADHIAEIRRNVRDGGAFEKRMRRWFNAFRCMKYLRFTMEVYGAEPAPVAALLRLLAEFGPVPRLTNLGDLRPLLRFCRSVDRRESAPALNA